MQHEGGSKTVLLVDDDPDLLEIGSEILERSGYRVVSAGSGEEALEIFRKGHIPIDLVLMDLTMPGMDGIRCMRQLMLVDSSVKVILMSGHSELHERRIALSEGARAYLSKPYGLKEMILKVKEVLKIQG
jgi:two-component system, cell cycle sensor histidine kinase and response regulator CckA